MKIIFNVFIILLHFNLRCQSVSQSVSQSVHLHCQSVFQSVSPSALSVSQSICIFSLLVSQCRGQTWILQLTNSSSTVRRSLSCSPAWCMPMPNASVSFRLESLTVAMMASICTANTRRTAFSVKHAHFFLIAMGF